MQAGIGGDLYAFPRTVGLVLDSCVLKNEMHICISLMSEFALRFQVANWISLTGSSPYIICVVLKRTDGVHL